MNSEMQQLSREWHEVFGTDIPYRVEVLGPAEIRMALEHGRQRLQPMSKTMGNDDSLMVVVTHKQH